MNKEIEYLLNEMKDATQDYIGTNGCKYQDLLREEIDLLLSYIEQLEDKINWYENIDINKTIDKFRVKHNEEIKELHNKIEQLENNRDKAIEFIKEIISSTKGVLNDYSYNKEHNKQLIELLKEDVEIYKNILILLKGDSDDK